MAYFWIILSTTAISALTFLSGFGLGTLLLPVFTLFFPVSVAIAATAVVHLANNLFRLAIIGKKADYGVVLSFALPAALFAVLGALLLNGIQALPPIAEYVWQGHLFAISPLKLFIALLMALFAMLELFPGFQKLAFPPRLVPLGGMLSGFFGGLSGHQGALRSAFLIRLGLEKEIYVGTIAVASVVVDISRLLVYGLTFFAHDFRLLWQHGQAGVILVGCVAAWAGSVLGARWLKKVSMQHIHTLVGVLLILYAMALGLGWL